jgi:hypothetical protein
VHYIHKSSGSRPWILLMLLAAPLGAQGPAALPTRFTNLLDRQYPGWKLSSIPDGKFKGCFLGAMRADPLLDRKARTAGQLFFIGGDFDGDGRVDYAVSIVHGRRNLTIVMLDHQPVPKPILLLEEEEPGETVAFLQLYRKGSSRYRDEHGVEYNFPRDAIGMYRCAIAVNPEGMEYHPDIFIFRDGSFQREDWVPPKSSK